MLTNWKTTLAGVAAILTALGDIVHSLSTGTPVNYNVDIPAIIGGIGLIAAKDSSTSSTQAQVDAATKKANGGQ
jgi:hypothetical protein